MSDHAELFSACLLASFCVLSDRTIHKSLDNTTESDVRVSMDLRYQQTGTATGRPAFASAGFIARSKVHPETELRDPKQWAANCQWAAGGVRWTRGVKLQCLSLQSCGYLTAHCSSLCFVFCLSVCLSVLGFALRDKLAAAEAAQAKAERFNRSAQLCSAQLRMEGGREGGRGVQSTITSVFGSVASKDLVGD